MLAEVEGDARALVASGGSEHPTQFYRNALDEALTGVVMSSGPPVAPEVAELNRALGVG